MKWAAKDATALEKEKEYIDTAVIPLIPAGTGPDFLQTVQLGEFALLLSEELERRLRGRVMLSVPFTYLHKEEGVEERLLHWKEDAERAVRHVFFLTSDPRWKTAAELQDRLIWIPSMPLHTLDHAVAEQLLDSHLDQIMNILLQFWNCK
ncbi:DUF2487 family protein [Bacillus mangrovi]|uniref:DUF2487 family protein n=1 Tax=Metabacillus mangrovi TaxID=1491830 RepID=A0A7X2S1U4_9BACI|nr:DUF2487 family protein [Metabacillus mangrovi]MTH52159.1 DUF2487 family protein [Metabacillus mangrovi]